MRYTLALFSIFPKIFPRCKICTLFKQNALYTDFRTPFPKFPKPISEIMYRYMGANGAMMEVNNADLWDGMDVSGGMYILYMRKVQVFGEGRMKGRCYRYQEVA